MIFMKLLWKISLMSLDKLWKGKKIQIQCLQTKKNIFKDILNQFKSAQNFFSFSAWNEELNKQIQHDKEEEEHKAAKPNFRNVLIRTFGVSLIPLGLICFVEECVIRLVIIMDNFPFHRF